MEYDGLSSIVAATAIHPELFTLFFRPWVDQQSHSLVLGRSAVEHGIRDGRKVCLGDAQLP